MRDKTTNQLIADELRFRPSMRPTDVKNFLSDHGIDVTPDEVIERLESIKDGLDDETMYAAPPECANNNCQFVFDVILNIPSKCPDCYSTMIEEPQVTIEENS